MNDATYMQIGRNCLADFTGIASPEALCARAEILFSAFDLLSAAEDDGFGNERRFVTVADYLPFVACSIRRDGWLSRTAAREHSDSANSTADQAMNFGVFARPDDANRLEPTEKDYDLASATIEFCDNFFDGYDVYTISDYENSLRVAMASGIVQPKFTGIIASAIQFYQRDVERRAKNEVWAKMVANSKYQGTVGERGIFENLTVLSCRTWESQFGVTYFYSFVDESNNAFTYFASHDMNLSVGQVVSLKGSVKKHEAYTPNFAGAVAYAQTVLTRCVLVTRATVQSMDVITAVETKCSNSDVAGAPTYIDVPVKIYRIHLVDALGRGFTYTSKSKKRGVDVGSILLIDYGASDLQTTPTYVDVPCKVV
jgi:hypothetical protein